MKEDKRYLVCPDRNIGAAYERFLGRDSGAQFAAFGSRVGNCVRRAVDRVQTLLRLRSEFRRIRS